MGKATKERGKADNSMIDNDLRLKHMDNLIKLLDAPEEGNNIIYMIEGDDTRYQGKVIKKGISKNKAVYKITPSNRESPKGKVVMIEYNNKKFKIGNNI